MGTQPIDGRAHRIAELFAAGPQFQAAQPIPEVVRFGDVTSGGYGNSKWAGEVLLRQAFDHCGLPVTGIAPASFYRTGSSTGRPRAHYGGLPVDFVAEAVTTLGAQGANGFRSFDVMNPHDDGISLDTVVDWLDETGHRIQRIHDYDAWLTRFETALRALPDQQRRHSVLPLLDAFRRPQQPPRGAPAPTDAFRNAVRTAEIGADNDIPHLSADLAGKYVADLKHLGVFPS